MTKEEFKIEGMHCTGCASRLQRVLAQKEGIESTSVNFEHKNASVKFDEQKISEEELKQAIRETGFVVVPL